MNDIKKQIAQSTIYQVNGRWTSDNPIVARFIAIESMGNANARTPSGTYRGLFQLGKQWYKLNNFYDPQENFAHAKRNMLANIDKLQKNGYPVNATTLYLLHQQGAGGGMAILNSAYKGGKVPKSVSDTWSANGYKGERSAMGFLNYVDARIERDYQKQSKAYLGGRYVANQNPLSQTPIGTNSVLAPQKGVNTPHPQTPSQLLVGIMGDYRLGDTGSGSGDHYDLRARDAKGRRVDINKYLDRFFVDGKALNTYRQTGRYMERRDGYYHQGVDFGLNGSFGGKQSARQLFINPAFADQVAGVSSHFDKGSKGRSGGWYTKITFKDGVSVNVLHQNKKNMAQINQGWQGWQNRPQMGQGQAPNQMSFLNKAVAWDSLVGKHTPTAPPTQTTQKQPSFLDKAMAWADIAGGQNQQAPQTAPKAPTQNGQIGLNPLGFLSKAVAWDSLVGR